jgi:hypothetical protein
MIDGLILSFLGLIFSVQTILVVTAYLVVCHVFIPRLKEMIFSIVLQCFWAICFASLFCQVFFRGTRAYAAAASYWPVVVGTLLLLSFVPALVIWFVMRESTSRGGGLSLFVPPILGLFEIFWLVGVTQVVVHGSGLPIVPPPEILIGLVVVAFVLTVLAGLFLTGVSRGVFGPRAMNEGIVFFRLAGMVTVYIPLCLYGAWLNLLSS